MEIQTERFKQNAGQALGDDQLRTALRRVTDTLTDRRRTAVEALDDYQALRDHCGAVKAHTLDHLDHYLAQLADRFEANGGTVHFCADAEEAVAAVVAIARVHGARRAVKSKSMLSEEIELNEALEAAGVEPIETDLGEYILQVDGSVPSHLIAPAIHMTRERITELFHQKLGTPADADVPTLTAAARATLRRGFLEADLGISGVNFACADTGTLALVENEGNIRFTTTLPKVHVALMGLEKVLPRLDDLPAFLRILARSATGQKASSYVSLLTGPRRTPEVDGPDHLHLVIVDNGRSSVLADPKLRDALRCIRCGACLNTCPVYQQVGGHAYGWVYSGPIGAVLDPGLLGLEATADLPHASSLCGACGDVCPVKIPLPELLVEHRRRAVTRGISGGAERAAVGAFAFVAERPAAWDAATRLARFGGGLLSHEGLLQGAWLPVLRDWLHERDFPAPARRAFRDIWRSGLADEAVVPEERRGAPDGAGESA